MRGQSVACIGKAWSKCLFIKKNFISTCIHIQWTSFHQNVFYQRHFQKILHSFHCKKIPEGQIWYVMMGSFEAYAHKTFFKLTSISIWLVLHRYWRAHKHFCMCWKVKQYKLSSDKESEVCDTQVSTSNTHSTTKGNN
jgi:hypothetical protein